MAVGLSEGLVLLADGECTLPGATEEGCDHSLIETGDNLLILHEVVLQESEPLQGGDWPMSLPSVTTLLTCVCGGGVGRGRHSALRHFSRSALRPSASFFFRKVSSGGTWYFKK